MQCRTGEHENITRLHGDSPRLLFTVRRTLKNGLTPEEALALGLTDSPEPQMWSSTSRRGNTASDIGVKSLSAFVLLGFSQQLFLPGVSEWRGGITTFSPSGRNSGGNEGMLLIRTDSIQLGKEKENVFKWRCLYTELFIYLKRIWMLGWFSLVSVSSCDVTV